MRMLREFIVTNRDEIITRTRTKVVQRLAPRATQDEFVNGVPLFLTQFGRILEQEEAQGDANASAMGTSAAKHGGEMLLQGFTIAQAVHDYGDICQAVTELAQERNVGIPVDEFNSLNRCLDDAIASAVTEYSRQRDATAAVIETERQGYFAHELRNHLNTAMLAYQAVKTGRVGMSGSTIEVLGRSLQGLHDLIDRSLSEVRLAAGANHRERVRVAEFLEEMEIDASIDATNRGLQFSAPPVDKQLFINVDRHLFASAISNILQNAFKFTKSPGHVWLRTHSSDGRLSIDVEDQCGGLPVGSKESMFRPFERKGTDHVGLGLGLAISRRAIEANGGKISVRDLPGKGCIFTVDMPLAADVV